MNKLYNNRFIFIVSASILFIMILSFSAVALTKKNTTEFNDAGYIISSNKVVNFGSGTSYRYNLSEKIVFIDSEGDIIEADQSSFIHYKDGSIALLKNGAFVDLNAISEEIVPYYNITNKSMITYADGGYTIKNGSNTLSFDDILLRVTDDKYLIAGKNLKVRVPGIDELISGDYFELTFVADGIILVENEDISYQVTSADTRVYVGDKTILDLGTKNVLLDGETKLNLTQVTIDGNENITIVPEGEIESEESNGSGGSGSGEGDGTGSGSGNQSTAEPTPTDNEVSVELVSLSTDTQGIVGVFQINNQDKIKGDLNVTLTNVKTNDVINATPNIDSTGKMTVLVNDLATDTSYMLSISENYRGEDTEYFQRVITTESYGITLKKVMVTESEINYDVIFSDEADLSPVRVELYDNDGNLVTKYVEGNLVEQGYRDNITRDNNHISFTNLDSNSTYTLKITKISIYSNDDGFDKKTVKTLKAKPYDNVDSVIASVSYDGTSVFTLTVKGIKDKDSSVTKYTYYIYQVPDAENPNELALVGEPIESNNSTISLAVGEHEIQANRNYRYKAVVEYNDNEKVREVETKMSDKFISTGASVTFKLDDERTSFNTIDGSITLEDPDCTVPMPGRTGCDAPNNTTVSYYLNGVKRYKAVTFAPTADQSIFVVSDFSINGLAANTKYTMELNGNMIIESVTIPNTMIGSQFEATTTGIPTLKVVNKSDAISNYETPINVTLSLESNSSDTLFIDQVKTMKVKLYALDASNNRTQIGNIVNMTSDEIKLQLYNNDYEMTNKFFGINNMDELVNLIEDESGYAFPNYLIEFTDAYDVVLAEVTEESNNIPIDDNEVNTSISKSYLLEYYAIKKEATTAKVSAVYNRELTTQVEGLDGSTVVGYKINASIYVDDILRQYYGVTGADNTVNWDYVYYIYDEEDNLVYTSNKTKSTTHTFYLDDETIENYDRGNEYYFGFQIIMSDGVYPSSQVIALGEDGTQIFNPVKENPYIVMATWSSSISTITYMYKITNDVDEALYGNNIYIYDQENNLIDTEEISKSDAMQYVTFKDLTGGNTYKIMYNKINTALDEGYSLSSKGSFIFDTYYDINSDYTLKYSDSGNQLGVAITDYTMLNRGLAYDVKLSSGSKSSNYVFTKKDLVQCTDIAVDNCLVINYSELEQYQGANTTVEVDAYYENGLIGLNQESKYYVFKSDDNVTYLAVSPTGAFRTNSTNADGLYTYEYTTDENANITIKNHINNYSWSNYLTSANTKLSFTTGGVVYGSFGSFNPKVAKQVALTSDNKNFFFSSIIPMVQTGAVRSINEVNISVTPSGLTSSIVQNEFKSGDYKVYVDLYKDDTLTNPVTLAANLDLDDLNKSLSFNFKTLIPDHTYYYQVYAYILNSNGEYVRTELYDYRSDGVFEVRQKSTSTLSASEILSNVDVAYTSTNIPVTYTSRNLEFTTTLLNIKNYKLVYEVTNSNGDNLFADKTVEEISSTINFTYDLDDTFVFGNAGYKLKVTAITTDVNASELVLYDGNLNSHLKGNASINELRDPTFSISNKSSFVPNGENKYAIRFRVGISDPDLVIKLGQYYVKVVDDYRNSYTPNGLTVDGNGYAKFDLASNPNPELTYKNLDPNSYYTIEVKTSVFENNASLDNKNFDISGYDYVETDGEYNLSLGSGSLSVDNKVLTVDYNGASNLAKITRVTATVRKSNALVGTYDFTGSDIFELNTQNNRWKMTLDLSSGATELNNNDQIRLVVRYYANNLSGVEGLVGTVTYANYSNE